MGWGGASSSAITLTAGTTSGTTVNAVVKKAVTKYSWTNADVVALGASLTGDITLCTLPANTVVTDCYIVVDTTAAGVTTLTGAVGRTAAAYNDYIIASDLKVAANTIYGGTIATRGALLGGTGATQNTDYPSASGTTVIKMHFISTVQNLSATTTCTGHVYLETMTLP